MKMLVKKLRRERIDKYDESVTWVTHRETDAVPDILWTISETWKQLSDLSGDGGSCVLGAGFRFKYQKKWFFLPERSKWQGSLSWEEYSNLIGPLLCGIGCEHVFYDEGRMD